jgi:UDP-3-O-[3-hydroxymyristoyl] glucosamine N-acyltransferase
MNHLTHIGNPRFFNRTGPHPLAAVATVAGCVPPSRDMLVSGLASLVLAEPDEISFVTSRRHSAALAQTRAGAVIVDTDMLPIVPSGTVALITTNVMAAWAKTAALFHPPPSINPGVHSSATVMDGAQVDITAEVCAQAVIEPGADIGPGCKIGTGTVIGRGVRLGPNCQVGSNVSITHALIGARVSIHCGARIGQEGFGFTVTAEGFQTIPQLGCVIIEDDVEIGANTTIDRGALRNTVICAGTRLDNQVQIGHGARIGRRCAIAAQVGISGSTEIGDFCVIGGQAGFTEHLHVGARSRVGAQSGVMTDIDADTAVFGSPARPARQAFREIAALKKIARGAAS